MDGLGRYKTIWSVDFEFNGRVGDPPTPLCLVARELRSGRLVRLWCDQFPRQCPLETGPDSLFIAHYSTAEWNCFRALGWSLPSAVIDTFCEFRIVANNLIYPPGSGLLGALRFFGIPTIDGTLKQTMRDLILTGGPFTSEQQQSILNYCQSDTDSTAKLFKALASGLHVPFALHRGRYMLALSAVESAGIPIDTTMLTDLRARWDSIQAELIRRIDAPYRVYEGLTFKVEAFRHYLSRRGIPWPMLESGALDLKGDTFKDMSRSYPELVPLQELRSTLSALRHNFLAVGTDGRNRCMLSPFRSVTGRNQPSNSAFIFGAACWHRALIKPPPGYAVLYLDYQQQEHGIAAALSRDAAMMQAYRSGDPYLAFAKQARMVPASATKDSHPVERDLAKQCSLAADFQFTSRPCRTMSTKTL